MPEHLSKASPPPPKTTLSGSTFGQRREDIFRRLQQSAENCRLNYSGRKELATEKDDNVAELCEALEDAFSYGLRQQQATVTLSAASVFQNMQEIITGSSSASSGANGFATSDTSFWDFCITHLTPHERERYNNLKQVWTKSGRGRAFIRASLNENSLQRYLLTWINSIDELSRYYTPWSLLHDKEAAEQLPQIVGSLNQILFALTVDTTELNAPMRRATASAGTSAPAKEEPIIYAPTPVPVASVAHKQKRKTNAVERPIATANSTEDLLGALQKAVASGSMVQQSSLIQGTVELFTSSAANIDLTVSPPDPIEPELEFLKQPLPDFYPEIHVEQTASNDTTTAFGSSANAEHEYEDKSDTSSQYSKSSSANCSSSAATADQTALEEKLRDVSERCALLETRVAQLSLENRLLVRRLTQHFNESGIDPSSSLSTNFLITIPLVKLLKSRSGSSYYAYEIHITMRRNLEHWLLLRRYREFYKLHKSLLRTHPSISSVEFPPKKHFGNMNLVFVEERRQQLQIYLLNLVESLPQVEACKSRAELQKVFPFFRER